ncbi:MAG: methylmalonyl-CoA mutase, partial [Aurantibacter sp.]
MGDPKLFEEFSKVSATEWKQKIDTELKGADFEKTLVWNSPEGIKVRPFYHADDLRRIEKFSKTRNGAWRIGQSIDVIDEVLANKQALDALSRGAESIFFTIRSESIKLEELIAGINGEIVPTYFDFLFFSPSYPKKIRSKIKNAYLNLDCIGHLARTGKWFSGKEGDFEILKALKSDLGTRVLSVDGSLYQNAGAN